MNRSAIPRHHSISSIRRTTFFAISVFWKNDLELLIFARESRCVRSFEKIAKIIGLLWGQKVKAGIEPGEVRVGLTGNQLS